MHRSNLRGEHAEVNVTGVRHHTTKHYTQRTDQRTATMSLLISDTIYSVQTCNTWAEYEPQLSCLRSAYVVRNDEAD
jgi:hypothetical protein